MPRPDKPTAEEREWLLTRLADLVAEGGFERMVGAPLIEASEEWFPDRWSASAAGVRVLLRRLLLHAGLLDLEVAVTDYRAHPADSERLGYSEVLYAGHAGVQVDFEVHSLGKDDLIGILCHEVGKAYLDVLGLGRGPGGPYREAADEPGNDDEAAAIRAAQLGSIAALYLGLGVPAANAAQSARALSRISGNLVVGEWMITTAGGLPAQALAYLLAVQRVVRGLDAPAYGALLTNQAADFGGWCEELAGSRDELVRRLRLPPEAEWPPVPSSLDLVPLELDDDDPVEPPPPPTREFNRGRRVYRVRGTRVGASTLGAACGAAMAWVTLPASVLLALGLFSAATAAGIVLGNRRRRDVCSDPMCEEQLPPGADTCPRCAGTIAGEIRHRDERLDREEEAG